MLEIRGLPKSFVSELGINPSFLLTLAAVQVTPGGHRYTFRTKRKVPKTGVMLVGWGGNNGSTITAGSPLFF